MRPTQWAAAPSRSERNPFSRWQLETGLYIVIDCPSALCRCHADFHLTSFCFVKPKDLRILWQTNILCPVQNVHFDLV